MQGYNRFDDDVTFDEGFQFVITSHSNAENFDFQVSQTDKKEEKMEDRTFRVQTLEGTLRE